MSSPRRTFIKTFSVASALILTSAFGLIDTVKAQPSNATARSGGEITFLISSLEGGWGPNEKIDTYTGIVWGQVADKLVHVDAKGEITPWIVERWDENDDQTQFTLHIKKGVTFSDGTPLDAKTVARNIDFWAKGDPERGIGRLGLFPSATYKGSEVLDDHTVRVSFSGPTLSFIATLGYHKTVLRTIASIELPATDLGNLSKQFGSGPYVVDSWQEGDRVVLLKRKDYNWGPVALGGSGAANLDRITFKVVKDASLRASAVQSGQAEVALNVSPQEIKGLKAKGIVIAAPDSLGFSSGYSINVKAPNFDDVNVRRAVQHAINRKEIVATVFTEEWKVAKTLLQSNVPEAGDYSKFLAFDPEQSKRLLEESGWKLGSNGVRTKNGEPLKFVLYASPWVSTSRAVSELVTQQLQQVGIQATLQIVDIATFNARVRNNNNVPLREQSRSFLDAGVVGNILTDGQKGDNWFGYDQTNETLNKLANDISNSSNRKTRIDSLHQAQAYVLDQALFIPTVELVQRLYVQSPKLKDVEYSGAAYPLYHRAHLEN